MRNDAAAARESSSSRCVFGAGVWRCGSFAKRISHTKNGVHRCDPLGAGSAYFLPVSVSHAPRSVRIRDAVRDDLNTATSSSQSGKTAHRIRTAFTPGSIINVATTSQSLR